MLFDEVAGEDELEDEDESEDFVSVFVSDLVSDLDSDLESAGLLDPPDLPPLRESVR